MAICRGGEAGLCQVSGVGFWDDTRDLARGSFHFCRVMDGQGGRSGSCLQGGFGLTIWVCISYRVRVRTPPFL